MSITLHNWKIRTRVLVRHEGSQYDDIEYTGAGNEVEIITITNFEDNEDSPVDILDFLNVWRAGYVTKPHGFTWTMDLLGNGQGALLMRHLQRDNKEFTIIFQENETVPEDLQGQYVYETEVLGDARVTGRRNVRTAVDVPRIRFTGTALRAAYAGSKEYGNYPYYVG